MNYQILDSGNGKRLEQVGSYRLIRPYSPAIWSPSLNKQDWQEVDAEFKGNLDGGAGKWIIKKKIAENFALKTDLMTFECKLTDYGHIGFFYEQHKNWLTLAKKVKKGGHYLNLFAYTGGSSMALAQKAKVTHVDSAKSVIKWAKRNAIASNIPHDHIRWINEDALKFTMKELKRKSYYDGIILDPPTFGRGTKKEIWKIEKDLMNLLHVCRQILSPEANIFLLSAHAHGFNNFILQNILQSIFPEKTIISNDLTLPQKDSKNIITLGSCASWFN